MRVAKTGGMVQARQGKTLPKLTAGWRLGQLGRGWRLGQDWRLGPLGRGRGWPLGPLGRGRDWRLGPLGRGWRLGPLTGQATEFLSGRVQGPHPGLAAANESSAAPASRGTVGKEKCGEPLLRGQGETVTWVPNAQNPVLPPPFRA